MIHNEIIYQSSDTRVEYYFNAEVNHHDCAFVFSPSLNRTLEGNNYGGDTLIKNGFDVFSIKNINDNWFQELSQDTFDKINQIVRSKCYIRKVSYGCSAGGFAAIAFSNFLNCTKVIAISPQYAIDMPFDTRWAAYASLIKFKYTINTCAINQSSKFIIIYDAKSKDSLHVDLILSHLSAELYKFNYSGHQTINFLDEVGYLKDVLISLSKDMSINVKAIKTKRKMSSAYFEGLSEAYLHKRKFKKVIYTISKAISIKDKVPAFYFIKSCAFKELGEFQNAIDSLLIAISLAPENPHFLLNLSDLYKLVEDFDKAIIYSRNAYSLATSNTDFLLHFINLLYDTKNYKVALSYIDLAIDSTSKSDYFISLKHKIIDDYTI